MFNASKLSLARRRRQLNKTKFAGLMEVTSQTVLRWESGEVTPPEDVVRRIAERLMFPVSFFYTDAIDEISPHTASFRSMSKMTAGVRDAALAAGSIAYTFMDWVETRFTIPVPDILDLRDETPEAAARSLRQAWGLGEKPVKNMVHLLEAKGVRVFSLAEDNRTMDAFSVWRMDKPYIFLNTIKSAEHSRFDAAHELGHLVLHKHQGATGREAEDEANQFASAFLMPESDVLAVLPRVHYLDQVVQAKKRWGVSVAALAYRLHKLNITSEWLNRTFCIELTKRGYRTTEPDGLAREQSIVWKQVLSALSEEGVTKNELCRILSLPASEIENLLFGLANMLSYDGQAVGSSKSRANLRVVE